jgi:serine/threonine protein kinase
MALDTKTLVETEPSVGPLEQGQSQQFGPYKVLRLLGRGGMGAVYLAEQQYPIRRLVALKVIKPGMDTREVIARFESERQALALMDHPNIARVYDAGSGDGGRPYFAMEYVSGIPITEYCDRNRLTNRERLDLFLAVCHAVQHAHQKGIIHRDLKPSNVLVSVPDGVAVPKIIDFGVAKAVNQKLIEETFFTEHGMLIGTPEYMSPEQAALDGQDVDTTSDIYSLGVVLYELLVGVLPFDPKALRKAGYDEMRRIIREEETPRPTARLHSLGAQATDIAALHQTTAEGLKRQLRGDLDWITLKAMDKDRRRRYNSAAEFGGDIGRYLSNELVIASPPSASYQLQKFACRNKALVTGFAAVFIVLVAGIVTSTLEASLANQARNRATAAEQMATAERDRAVVAQTQAMAAEERTRQERDSAVAEQLRADMETAKAKIQRLITIWQSLAHESLRESATGVDYDDAALLAVQAMRFNARIPNQPHYLVEDALQQAAKLTPPIHNLPNSYRNSSQSVAFSRDGTHVAAGGNDQIVRLWDLKNPGAPPVAFDAHGPQTIGIRSVVFSSDGTRLAVGSAGANDTKISSIRIWNLGNTSAPPLILEGGSIGSLSFSPDGFHLASGAEGFPRGGGNYANPRNTGGVVMWDIRNPKTPRVISQMGSSQIGNCPTSPDEPPPFTPGSVSSLAFSPDGSRLASASGDCVQIWDTENPNRQPLLLHLLPWSPPPGTPPQTTQHFVHSAEFSPDGAHLAAAGYDGVQVWNLRNLQAAPVSLMIPFSGPYGFRSLTYAADGTHIAAINGAGAVWIWDLRNPDARPSSFLAASEGIAEVAYSPDGSRLATAGRSGVLVWDLEHADSQPTLSQRPRELGSDRGSNVDDFAYSADLARFASASGKTLRVWDLRRPEGLPTLLDGHPLHHPRSGPDRSVSSMAFSLDGAYLAAVSVVGDDRDGIQLSVWDLRNADARGQMVLTLVIPNSPPAPRPDGSIDIPFSRVVFSPDGVHLAASGSTVHIVDMRRPTAPPLSLGSPQLYPAGALAFSLDGRRLAVGSVDNNVQVWDLRNPGAPPLLFPMPTPGSIRTIAFSADGSRLAASLDAGRTAVWDLRNPGAPAGQFEGAIVLAFSTNSARLATIPPGGVQILDLRTPGAPAVELPLPLSPRDAFGIHALAFSPDGTRLTAGALMGQVVTWRLWSAAAEYLCSRVWRNLSADEWRHYMGEGIPYERTCPRLPSGAGAPN